MKDAIFSSQGESLEEVVHSMLGKKQLRLGGG